MSGDLGGVSPDYLNAAREAGLLHELDGRPYVAGEYHDEAGGERQCMVEYCHPDLLTDGATGLLGALSAAFPTADAIVARTDCETVLPTPWSAHLTYVRYTGTPLADSLTPAATVIPATAAHDDLIHAWLVRAFEAYGDEQQHHGDTEEVRATADRILAAPDRRSFVALAEDRPIGHVTLLCDGYDDVSVGHHVELLDCLVDADPPQRREATALLTTAAALEADRLGLPLLGHVVHPAATAQPDRSSAVLHSLLAHGWTVDHRYWRRAGRRLSAQ